ncbi:hypothetical protein BU26DRAFT_595215 [Trematosphaeria pertusa]|uniref:Alpha/beta hydrolase fold-3 domain-containing protein n=1 Tax=Trematosphaeria pertusa TaxID=390896 RepID=A0A6A6IFL2_9PLEO|nr:uncharacterized protein BU26DRAFT_595215 [Trematosphaeria pertusa]KAF2249365.1 hypothetical protein BU26DRAFT_595215 [Trematosphaeria pertusa]
MSSLSPNQIQKLAAELKALNEAFDKSKPKKSWDWDKAALVKIWEKANPIRQHRWEEDLSPKINWLGKELNKEEHFYELSGRPKGVYGRFSKNAIWKGFWLQEQGKSWFHQQGFTAYRIPFAYTDTWDKQVLELGILIPHNLDRTRRIGSHVKFHGGGCTTGDCLFEPWFAEHILRHARANNIILLCPNYRLMPEANGAAILQDIDQFWDFYLNCPYLTEFFQEVGKVELDREQSLISGESAGVYCAVASWLRHSDKLSILALYLQYGMLAYYERVFPCDAPGFDEESYRASQVGEVLKLAPDELVYMGHPVKKEEVNKRAKELMDAVQKLEAVGQLPTCTGRAPPNGMLAAFTTSTSPPAWRECLQRGGTQTPDIINMLKEKKDPPKNFPPMFLYHGHDDPNCPIEKNSQALVDLCCELFPKHYIKNAKDPKIVLKTVTEIRAKDKDGKPELKKKVGHGFDYPLHEDWNPFIAEGIKFINSHWQAAQSAGS